MKNKINLYHCILLTFIASISISLFHPLLGQQKRVGFINTSFSQPNFSPIPVMGLQKTKKEIDKLSEKLKKKEKGIIDSLRNFSTSSLEDIFGYELIKTEGLRLVKAYHSLESYPLPSDELYGEMILASNEKNLLPVDKMKINNFFKLKNNYSNQVIQICERLDLDAIIYCNWQLDVWGYTINDTYSAALICKIYLIDKNGESLLERWPRATKVFQLSLNEPEMLLDLITIKNCDLTPFISFMKKPKWQKKLRKAGL